MEPEIRTKAIVSTLNGESPKDICTELKRSERWFFNWLSRFKMGDLYRHKDRSRAPLTKATKISEKKRQLIIRSERDLSRTLSTRMQTGQPYTHGWKVLILVKDNGRVVPEDGVTVQIVFDAPQGGCGQKGSWREDTATKK